MYRSIRAMWLSAALAALGGGHALMANQSPRQPIGNALFLWNWMAAKPPAAAFSRPGLIPRAIVAFKFKPSSPANA